jgi:hypothetical protein
LVGQVSASSECRSFGRSRLSFRLGDGGDISLKVGPSEAVTGGILEDL